MRHHLNNLAILGLVAVLACIGLMSGMTGESDIAIVKVPEPTPDEHHAAKRLLFHGAILTKDENGYVTKVSLKHNREVSLLCMKQLMHLPKLSHLYLEYSSLDDSMTEPLQALSSLRHLSLNGTNITKLTMKRIGKLVNLESLNLRALAHHKDGIGDKGAWELRTLRQLKVLNLTMNMDLSSSGFEFLKTLTNLRSLYLTDTGFNEDSVAYLTELNRLQILHTPDISPFKLRSISHLPIRNLNCGDLERHDVEHLTRFKKLESLPPNSDNYLSDNTLKHLAKFTKIKTLVFAEGPVSDHGLIRIPELSHIEELTITNNGSDYPEITSDGLKRLSQLKNLKRLTLIGLKVDDSFLESIANLNNLEFLKLSFLPISGEGLRFLHNSKLRHLVLEGSRITNASLKHLQQLENLTNLELHDTPVSNEGLRHLALSGNIEKVRLRSTSVDADGIEFLIVMPELRRLDISFTGVDDKALAHLARCPSLEEINVSNCKITDTGLEYLKRSKSIRALGVYNTEVSWESANTFWEHFQKQCWITDNWCCGCMEFNVAGASWRFY